MKKAPKVGKCCYCGHWGLLWGRWCKHPDLVKAGPCRIRWSRWVRGKNGLAKPLNPRGFITLGPQPFPDVFGRFYRQPGTSIFVEGAPLTVDYGRMKKRFLHD